MSQADHAVPASRLPPLEPLEVWSGVVFGTWRHVAPVDPGPPPGGVRETLGQLLLPALEKPPCFVAFSGGRDSSVILAAATECAREHGLSDPIPLTLHYPDHPRTWESEWQELVIGHLQLQERRRVDLNEELDVLGAPATAALAQHGLFYPPNCHTLLPLLQAAGSGTLLTGNGGDEVLAPWYSSPPQLLRGRRHRPTSTELKYIALHYLPRPARIRAWRSRRPLLLPWLSASAQREVKERYAVDMGTRTTSWMEDLDYLLASRSRELGSAAMQAMADEAGVALIEPFFDARFMRAMAAAAPRDGFPSRTNAIGTQFGDLLPAAIVARETKAVFTEVLWGAGARGFIDTWDGGGVDPAYVDPDALRREWARPRPDMRSVTALQAAWLAAQVPSASS